MSRGERGCHYFRETFAVCLTLDASLLGYQVQTIPQFLYPLPVVGHSNECKPLTSSELHITTLTFGNDDKSHNEITVQLLAKVA